MKRVFAALLLLCFTFCSNELMGFFVSSDVDTRFKESAGLSGSDSLQVIDSVFTFVAVADVHLNQGTSQHLSSLLTMLRSSNDAFLLLCGDNVQNGGESDFFALRDSLNHIAIPRYLTLGNHDIYSGGWEYYRSVFGRSVYSVSNGRVRLIILDTGNGTLGKLQREWLEQVLVGAGERLKIVSMHFNLVSPGLTEMDQLSDTREIACLMHLFETSGVKLVLMGHSHIWDDRTINGVRYVTLANLGSDDGGFYARFGVTGDSAELVDREWMK
jgi:3',5'-cyclic AMP phosphodiesterase CpdA